MGGEEGKPQKLISDFLWMTLEVFIFLHFRVNRRRDLVIGPSGDLAVLTLLMQLFLYKARKIFFSCFVLFLASANHPEGMLLGFSSGSLASLICVG